MVDSHNTSAVDEIVDVLEGIPLAIELAAARVRLLPPEAILERLDRRLDFLAGGATDLPERQRALRTTMDWSNDLLDDVEKLLFARLGIFPSSFSLTAAEMIGACRDQSEALVLLESLVDKSLLVAEASDLEPRFRMLLLVHDYARERLDVMGELEDAGRCHAEFYRDLTRFLEPALRGPLQAEWVDRLDRGAGAGDIDNVRAALRWFIERGELDEAARMLWSMWLLGWVSGRLNECNRWARDALAAPGVLSANGRAKLLTVAGLFETWKSEFETAVPSLTEAVTIARQIEDDEILANALLGLSLVSSFVHGVDAAREHAHEAEALHRARGDRWGQAMSNSVLTWLLVAQDDFEASEIFLNALAVADDLADELNRSEIEANVAEFRLHRGDLAGAGQLLVSSLGRYRAFAPSIRRPTRSTPWLGLRFEPGVPNELRS